MAEEKEMKNPVQSAARIFQVMEMLADQGEMGLMELSTALGLQRWRKQMAEEKEMKNPVQSAARIFQVMEMLADQGEMGLMELSTALGLHKSTVHRLLMSLIYMGYARQDESSQKYMLSYKLVNMASRILDRMDILQIAKPYLEQLSDLSKETVHLVRREGNNILYIYKIEAKIGTIRMVSHVGMVHPMYCSGVGKAMMAVLPESEVQKIWNESVIEKRTDHTITDYEKLREVHPMYCSGVGKAMMAVLPESEVQKIWNESVIEKRTDHTITDYEKLREALEEVRKNGYALDDEENEEGVRCIAASLRGCQKEVLYAFSISGPASRMTKARIEELAVDVCRVQGELSKALGYVPVSEL